MTSKELLDRIAALVALASSPSIEEARTAAHKACALMREHGAIVGLLEDGVLATKSVGIVQAGKPAPRRTPEHRTAIIFRCSRCGGRVPTAGLCQACIDLRTPMGVWTVDCEGCGRSTPPGRTEIEVNEIAYGMGFRVNDEGLTLCPRCIAQQSKSA